MGRFFRPCHIFSKDINIDVYNCVNIDIPSIRSNTIKMSSLSWKVYHIFTRKGCSSICKILISRKTFSTACFRIICTLFMYFMANITLVSLFFTIHTYTVYSSSNWQCTTTLPFQMLPSLLLEGYENDQNQLQNEILRSDKIYHTNKITVVKVRPPSVIGLLTKLKMLHVTLSALSACRWETANYPATRKVVRNIS